PRTGCRAHRLRLAHPTSVPCAPGGVSWSLAIDLTRNMARGVGAGAKDSGILVRRCSSHPHERSGRAMAVPKRKMSRSNTRSRRSQWKAELTQLVTVRVRGREIKVPRRLAKAYQKGLVDAE